MFTIASSLLVTVMLTIIFVSSMFIGSIIAIFFHFISSHFLKLAAFVFTIIPVFAVIVQLLLLQHLAI